jgi:hypothetical protein
MVDNGTHTTKDKYDDEDDPSVHLARFQQSHQKMIKKMEEDHQIMIKKMKEEKDKLQNEIDTMNSAVGSAASSDDFIIEINAGGKIISALRSTLTLAPDTRFTYMFSGRWEKSLKRDECDRIFLDEESELIEIIINFLRMKKREDPFCPIDELKLPASKKENFDSILDHYGLTEFFYPNALFLPFSISKIDVVQPHGSLITVSKSDDKIQLTRVNEKSFQFVAFRPSLNPSEEGSFWKVTIDALPEGNKWLFLGIIGNLRASNDSHTDPTSYGQSSGCQVYHGGLKRKGESGWTTFTEGECLYFHLKSNKLTMFSVQKNRKFVNTVANPLREYYIHFNLYAVGTKITLETLDKYERKRMLEN